MKINRLSQINTELYNHEKKPNENEWTSANIASKLWLDPITIISDETLQAVNLAHNYLGELGYSLKGTPSDGNCFFAAFYNSYQSLKRAVPLLDSQNDPISYLRDTLSDLIDKKSAKRSGEIKTTGEWVDIEEGKELAHHFDIPIRVITAERNAVKVFDSLIFSNKDVPEQEWQSIPEPERPEEFILIIDLGGHFIYAAPSDSETACKQEVAEELETKRLINKSPIAESASDSALKIAGQSRHENDNETPECLPEHLVDADDRALFRTGPFELKSEYLQDGGFSVPLQVLLKNMPPSESRRMVAEMYRQTASFPAMRLNAKKLLGLFDHITQKSQTESLERIVESLNKDRIDLENQITKAFQAGQSADGLIEESTRLQAQTNSFQEHVKKSKAKEQTLEDEWKAELKGFYKLCNLFNAILKTADNNAMSPTIRCQSIWHEKVFTALEKLVQKKPYSIDPYIPLLTTCSFAFPPKALDTIFAEAKNCDKHMTYAFTLYYVETLLGLLPKSDRSLCHRPSHTLTALHKAYPMDLYAKALLDAVLAGKNQFSVNYSEAGKQIENAFRNILGQNVELCLALLAKTKQHLVGLKNIDRYLAFIFAFDRKPERAEEFLQRTKILAENKGRFLLHSPYNTRKLSKVYNPTVLELNKRLRSTNKKLVFPKGPTLSKIAEDPIVRAFIDLTAAKDEDRYAKLRELLDQAVANLSNNPDDIHLIYLAVKWIQSNIQISAYNQNEILNSCLEELSRLASCSAAYAFSFENVDPWLEAHFENTSEDPEHIEYCVSFDGVLFTSVFCEDEPEIKFYGLELTSASVKAISTKLTKEIWNLMTSFFAAHCLPLSVAEDLKSDCLPESPAIFTTCLTAGIPFSLQPHGSSEPLFELTRRYLKLYEEKKPYPLNEDIIKQAQLAIFSASLCSYNVSAEKVEADEIKNLTSQSKQFLKGLKVQYDNKRLQVCLRDALLAQKRVTSRELGKTVSIEIPPDKVGVYEAIERFQTRWGWQKRESLEEWGKRLDLENKRGPLAADYQQLNKRYVLFLDETEDETGVSFPINSDKNLKLYKDLLRFWRLFIQGTIEKNKFISEGFDDDCQNRDNFPNSADISIENWKYIITESNPKVFPNYQSLSEPQKKILDETISAKHFHTTHICQLSKSCTKPGWLSDDSYTIIMTAILSLVTEQDRKQIYHSIFVEQKELATNIYQILLEFSLERLVRASVIKNGLHARDELISYLEPLKGAFHGPESHFAGNGPLETHYNAGIYTYGPELINTHIYLRP